MSFDAIDEARRQWGKRHPEKEHMAASAAIMRAQQIVLAQIDPLLKPADLTFARYELLMLLSFTRDGAASMGRLGERLMIHPTSVTNLVDRLERAGYVTREPNPADRRGILARITPEGRAAATDATAKLVESKFGLTGLTDAEARQLIALIRKARVAAGDLAAD